MGRLNNMSFAMGRTQRIAGLLVGAALAVLAFAGTAVADQEPASTGGPTVFRRLTPDQYKHIIADVFGPSIKLAGGFEPDVRADGLLAVGTSQVSVTATGMEQYDAAARTIAEQVVSEQYRGGLIPCQPASKTEPDDACAKQFLSTTGRLLYRRPLTTEELSALVSASADSTRTLKSFYAGLQLGLADMLEAPQFLFRQETAEPDPDHPGLYRVDAYGKAARLSFLLWNTAPDTELLDAAQSGELNTQKGLDRQVDRLLSSPRLEASVRAFFSDMLGFDGIANLSKDSAIYPRFNVSVARDGEEQTLRTIVDLLLAQKGDYRDIFTTRRTFMTPALGRIYKLPIPRVTPNGEPDAWTAYEFPEGDPRAGILSQVSFVALHSHPGRSSPTLRGKALREIIMCQKVPDPPANVNFTVVQDTSNPKYKTARERVTAHRTDPACAGCHKIMDPMGLALENFDSAGGFRMTENGAPIDASGDFDGLKFTSAAELGKAIHDHPATASCLVNRLYSYAVGHVPAKGEGEWMKYLQKSFVADGYRLPDMLRQIATSDAFYRVSAPQTGAIDRPTQLASQPNSVQESGK